MTEVITLVIHPRDGVCIEREQPSTAVKPMPAYGALNSSFKAASQPVDVITTEVVPGQQNGDADSNDVVIGYYLSSVDSESDVIDAITIFVKPVAAGADDQNDLILNYGAFDGASMLEAYEATRADAYSQKDTLASAVEAPYNEMNYILDPSQGPSNTTDESESLMFVAMMTVDAVGL